MNIPEKLNIFDRFFNRYRKEIVKIEQEPFNKFYNTGPLIGQRVPNSTFYRDCVTYKTIDRITGSETIKKEYLN